MALASLAVALTAGVLSTLSPCVLPLLPIVLGAAVGHHRFGPAALAGGVALSFTVIGLFIATVGFSIGLTSDAFRVIGSAVLIALGLILIIPQLSAAVTSALSPLGGAVDARFGGLDTAGLGGQFTLGLLLGAVWSPCVGPTLGAASLLAAQGRNLPEVAAVMASFGIGAAIPLLLLGLLSREAMVRLRSRLMTAGSGGKAALGALLVIAGTLIITGLDKTVETRLVGLSPAWLTQLTTRF